MLVLQVENITIFNCLINKLPSLRLVSNSFGSGALLQRRSHSEISNKIIKSVSLVYALWAHGLALSNI